MILLIIYIVLVPLFCHVYYHNVARMVGTSVGIGMVWPIFSVYRLALKFVNWICK